MGKLQPGVNDLETWCKKNGREELLQEWDCEKNREKPNEIAAHSGKKAWWIDKYGHNWEAIIDNRTSKESDCPYCSGRCTIKGINDLQTVNPGLAEEWNYEKNVGLTPADFLPNSNKKVWWKCKTCHGEWQTSISNRTSGKNCPYCSSKKVLSGYNDLETTNPKLAKEWHPTKNSNLSPNEVTPSSDKKAWWLGACGHEWQSTIASRNRGNGCPICARELQTSFPEQAIFFYLNNLFPSVKNRFKIQNNEFDIYLQDYNIAIEYDGLKWHQDKSRDMRKNIFCKNNNIYLIRLREFPLEDIENCVCIQVLSKNNPSLKQAIESVIRLIEAQIDIKHKIINIDIDNDEPKILEYYYSRIKQNSVFKSNLLQEWNYNKNNKLNPEYIPLYSNKKVWWKCQLCGHEWLSTVSARTQGSGCPVCGIKKSRKTQRLNAAKKNNFLENYPDIANEWNYEKNDEPPENYACSSNKKVWWKCKTCHGEWRTSINNRTSGKNCPYCSNRQVLRSFNDLSTMYPQIAKEWHPTKNGNLSPENIYASSDKKVWWRCSKGHKWQASIYSRTKNNTGCPICANKQVLSGYNDLATINPGLAAEWHPTKNGDLTPAMVTAGSNKKVWWKCSQGHEWEGNIARRTSGRGCPYCSGHQVLPGYNDLNTTNPELAKQWHPIKNGDLRPDMITSGSGKKVWWICENGHEWSATIASRKSGTGCLICAQQMINVSKYKCVINLDTDDVCKSLKEASVKYNISVKNISACLHGRQKTAGGYHWKFYEEEGGKKNGKR